MSQHDFTFPAGFLWGAATAAFQVEGAVAAEGRGPSIWDEFTSRPGVIRGGDDAVTAADHYHRWPADIALMKDHGLQAYRFSLSWSRIVPTGTGRVNQAGLDHYRRLVDALLASEITPMVTLYHWDLPLELQATGGWAARSTAYRFADYAGAVADAIGDRVPMWNTFNEPWASSFLGYGSTLYPPAVNDGRQALLAAHHQHLAHGYACEILGSTVGMVGIALNVAPVLPASDVSTDLAAARRFDGNLNRWFLEPILTGAYPADMVEIYGSHFQGIVADGDMEVISRPIDFLGVNYYCPHYVAAGHDPAARWSLLPTIDAHVVNQPGVEKTPLGWPIDPPRLSQLLIDLTERYPRLPPIYITENGAAFDEPDILTDGHRDDDRIGYLRGHLRALHTAMGAGVDIRGYFCWSLMDNFEWTDGYSQRFGLIHVNFDSGQRTPKASAAWYRDAIRRNGPG